MDWRWESCRAVRAPKLPSLSFSIGGTGIDEETLCVPLIFQNSPLTRTSYLEDVPKVADQVRTQVPKSKLNIKVLSVENEDGKVVVTTEVAKDRKRDAVRGFQISLLPAETLLGFQKLKADVQLALVAIGRKLCIKGPKFENTSFEVDPCGCIVIDDQFNGPVDNQPYSNQALIKLHRSCPFCPISTWQRAVVDTLGSRLREL